MAALPRLRQPDDPADEPRLHAAIRASVDDVVIDLDDDDSLFGSDLDEEDEE